MAECYGSWLCEEAEREQARRERIENAKMRIEDELYEALDGDLHDFYDILINATGFAQTLEQLAKQRYPSDFGLDRDDF